MSDESSDLLYVHDDSVTCAIYNNCVICLYRLLKFLPTSSTESFKQHYVFLPPNKRPETCPRFNTRFQVVTCGLYRNSLELLTVGDGDFSFSLSLMNAGHQNNKLTATSYESYNTITTVYPNCKSIIQQLETLGVKVYHQVDAANLSNSPQIKIGKFDIIIRNFPCIGIEAGADGQAEHIEKNQQLLHDFFQYASVYLLSKGKQEVHLTHKTIEPFSWWDIINIGRKNNYAFVGSVVFDRSLYPGYIDRKALDKKNFPSTDAQTFVFKWKNTEIADFTINKKSTSTSTSATADIQIQQISSSLTDNHSLSLFNNRVAEINEYVLTNFSNIKSNKNTTAATDKQEITSNEISFDNIENENKHKKQLQKLHQSSVNSSIHTITTSAIHCHETKVQNAHKRKYIDIIGENSSTTTNKHNIRNNIRNNNDNNNKKAVSQKKHFTDD